MTMSNYIECVQWFIILLGKTEASLQNYLIFSTIIHAAAPSPALFLPWAFHFQAFCVYSGPMKGALNLWEVFQELVKKPSGSLKRKKNRSHAFESQVVAQRRATASLVDTQTTLLSSTHSGVAVWEFDWGLACRWQSFFPPSALKSDSQATHASPLSDSLHYEAPHPTCIFHFRK